MLVDINVEIISEGCIASLVKVRNNVGLRPPSIPLSLPRDFYMILWIHSPTFSF